MTEASPTVRPEFRFKNPPTELFVTITDFDTGATTNHLTPVEVSLELNLTANISGLPMPTLLVLSPLENEKLEEVGIMAGWDDDDLSETPPAIYVPCNEDAPPTCVGFAKKTVGGATLVLGCFSTTNLDATINIPDLLMRTAEDNPFNYQDPKAGTNLLAALMHDYIVLLLDFPATINLGACETVDEFNAIIAAHLLPFFDAAPQRANQW